MKFKFFMLPVLFITGSVLFFASCEKENSLPVQADQATLEVSSIVAIDDAFIKEITQEVAAYKAQLTETAESNLSPCPTKIVVPDDYATIQEAVDAACHENGTDIIVKAGTYDEGVVFVTKPDLHIKANGEVTLIGGFSLDENADNTQIHKFNIVLSENSTAGIVGVSFTGGEFKQNTISGSEVSNYIGIIFGGVFDVNIKQNTVSNLQWGISIISGYGPSQNNSIQDNTISDIFQSSPIHLQGDCDYNMIKGNTITNCTNFNNAGIFLFGNPGISCDNNTIKNNVVTGNTSPGLWAFLDHSGNIIGPNNVFNSNEWGIELGDVGSDNHVFNNTALNNTNCDISNYGNNNTFSNNEADCTIGL